LTILACHRGRPAERVNTQPARVGSLVDNGDGTLTDTATGLVWEKKCNCRGTVHDFEATYFWSGDGEHETIWDWLRAVNAEGTSGFAGHADWRIPNVKELVSLVDYETSGPAIASLLGACTAECTEPSGAGCGCTSSGPYWTSTTFADFPAHALTVGFAVGGIDDQLKTLRGFVRAVRGPLVPSAPAPAAGKDSSAPPLAGAQPR
jgi:hypothetical protein